MCSQQNGLRTVRWESSFRHTLKDRYRCFVWTYVECHQVPNPTYILICHWLCTSYVQYCISTINADSTVQYFNNSGTVQKTILFQEYNQASNESNVESVRSPHYAKSKAQSGYPANAWPSMPRRGVFQLYMFLHDSAVVIQSTPLSEANMSWRQSMYRYAYFHKNLLRPMNQ